ncbi:MAG: serine hydrolase domain-containing protein [Vicinamibacterales bacterium]
MTRARRTAVAAAIAAAALVLAGPPGRAQTLPYTLFERYVEALRQQAGIPGLSAALVRNGTVDWERGFGRQDVGRGIPAAPDTPYPVGGLTQSVTATLLGRCAESGTLDIDRTVQALVPDFPDATATVREVLAHASDPATPGRFHYDATRFAALTAVAEACSGRPLRTAVATDILDRLGMASSVPGLDLATAGNAARLALPPAVVARYDDVLARVALPYRVDRSGKATRTEYPAPGYDAASGLVSTVRDLARLDAALDDGILLRPDTLAVAWRPAVIGGEPLPTGLGWFVQLYEGQRIVWQFSQEPDGYSALIVKVPARHVTLILLANSNGLASSATLETGDATTSPFVLVFLRLFAS